MATGPAAQTAHQKAQSLLLIKVQGVEKVAEGLHQRRHADAQCLDLGVQPLLGGLPGEGIGFHETGDFRAADQPTERPTAAADLVQQLTQRDLLALAQVQESADAGLQALAASPVGTKAQACTEAGPATRVAASPMARPQAASVAMAVCSPGSEACTEAWERPATGRQGAVGTSVSVSAERIEAAIKAVVVTVMFMVTAPATKQMHGGIPR